MNAELIKLVENFKREVFNKNELPNHKCFCVSYPLSLYLNMYKNYENELICSFLNYPTLTTKLHYWIELNTGVIVDITIDQFSNQLPIDELPIVFNYNDSVNKPILSAAEYKKWFKIYHKPLDKSIDSIKSLYRNLSTYLQDDSNNLKELLRVNLKAAIVLNNEIDRRGIDINDKNRDDSEKYLEYFEFINYIRQESFKWEELSSILAEFRSNEDYQNLILKIQSIQID